MKNRDKTIALTLLALILYALFVWRGMTTTQQSITLDRDMFAGLLNMPTPEIESLLDTQPGQQSNDAQEYKRSQEGFYQFSKIKFDVTGYKIVKYDGKYNLAYQFTWENTSNEPVDFLDANVCINAYQDGIECDLGGVPSIDPNNMTKIKPGKRLVSYYVIELKNTKSKVETHISEYFVDKKPITLNVDVQYLLSKKK